MIALEILRSPRRHQTLTTTMTHNNYNLSTIQPARPHDGKTKLNL